MEEVWRFEHGKKFGKHKVSEGHEGDMIGSRQELEGNPDCPFRTCKDDRRSDQKVDTNDLEADLDPGNFSNGGNEVLAALNNCHTSPEAPTGRSSATQIMLTASDHLQRLASSQVPSSAPNPTEEIEMLLPTMSVISATSEENATTASLYQEEMQ